MMIKIFNINYYQCHVHIVFRADSPIAESDVSYQPSNESIKQFNVDKHYDLRFVQMQFSCLHLKSVFLFHLNLHLTVFDLISEHALISEPPLFLKLKKKKIFTFVFF